MDGKSATEQWDNFEAIMKRGIDIYISHRTVDMANPKSRKPLWMNTKALAKVRKKTVIQTISRNKGRQRI